MVVDAACDLVSPLPVAGCDQVVDSRASCEIGLGEVLKEFLAKRVEAALRDDIVRESHVAVERVRNGFPERGKVSAQHLRGGNQSLQDDACAPAPRFIIGKIESLVFANRPTQVEPELVVSESRRSSGRAEELSRLQSAIAEELVSDA